MCVPIAGDDAKIGVRGSMARGFKGPQKGFEPFDPSKFDVDAFIVSDKLAAKTGGYGGFRSGRSVPELGTLSDEIQAELKRMYPGLKAGKDKFNFRIFTQKEWTEKFGPQAPFYFIE